MNTSSSSTSSNIPSAPPQPTTTTSTFKSGGYTGTRTTTTGTSGVMSSTGYTTGYEGQTLNEPVRLERKEDAIRVEHIDKPVVVQEIIHPVQKEEIQPIINRDIEKLEVHQIAQDLHETKIKPTIIEQKDLGSEERAPLVMPGQPVRAAVVEPSVAYDSLQATKIVHAPIVQETIHKTIREEVQPVLHRDVVAPTVIKEYKNIHETVIEAPTLVQETLPMRELGTETLTETNLSQQYKSGLYTGKEFSATGATKTSVLKEGEEYKQFPSSTTGFSSSTTSSTTSSNIYSR